MPRSNSTKWWTPRNKRVLAWTCGVLLGYTICGFFIFPVIARAVAVRELSKFLARPVTIRKFQLNPCTLSASIRGILIKDKDALPLASCEEASFNFRLTSVFTHAWVFNEISLSGLFLRVQVNQDYTLNISDILAKLSVGDRLESSPLTKPSSWRITRLRVIDGKLSFTDLTTRRPFKRTVGRLELTATNFQTDPGHKNAFALSGISDAGEQFSWSGSFDLSPLRSEGQVALSGFALTGYAPLYEDLFRFQIKDGVASLHSSYRYEGSAATNLMSLTNTSFELKSLEMVEKDTGRPVMEVSDFAVTGASADALARQSEADMVAVTGGRLFLRRNKDASVNAMELLKPADSAPPAPGGILLLLRAMTNLVALLLNTTNLANGAIRELNFTNCTVHLEDLVNPQPVRLDLEDIAVQAKNISNRTGTNMTAQVSLRWNTNGSVRAGLKAGLAPPNVEATLSLDKLNLLPLAPYLEPYLEAFVLGSKVGLKGMVRLRSTGEALPEVSFQGDAWLDGFSLAEGTAAESLVQWESLRLSGIDANLNPPVVCVTNARLTDVYARLVIETNRTLNLLSALPRNGANVAASPFSTNVAPSLRPRISLGSLVLSNANIHFIDRSLRPNVSITLTQLKGTISRLSSEELQPAEVRLEGLVDRTARAEITGEMNPWSSKQPLDLKLSLQGMDLLPGDPYSSKYLGYRLVKGNLSARLAYQISAGKLKSENRLTLEQLTLGEKVESADATSLPVRLAIALLKDRDGRIVLEVPMSGSLDDPQFNVGRMVYHALETVLVRIAASPFAVLGALFGGKGDELSFLEFPSGSTNLTPAAIAKLDILTKGLEARPELRLEIEGSADPVADLAALRIEKLNPISVPNHSALRFTNRVNGTVTAGTSFRKAPSIERGATALRSPQAHWPSIRLQSASSETGLDSHPAKPFADDKGATALMRIFAPQGAAEDPDSRPQLLEPEELPALASERAENAKAYLIQTGKIQPERISQSARGQSSKGSRVYLWLQ